MIKYNFWEDWKNKTQIEKEAIKSIILSRKLIKNAIPKDKLVAIYIKGSFIRREMKKGSDVDIAPIVTENKYEKKVFEVNSDKIYPSMVVPLSLWELKNNKLFTKHNLPRARPDRFTKKLKEYKLIYGKHLDTKNFKVRSNEESFKALIKIFKKSFIPLYKKNKLSFSLLLKELFWLVDSEQEVKGIKVKHSFKGIAKSVKDKNHIIHNAYNLRIKPTKDKKIKERFVQKLEKYIKKLDSKFLSVKCPLNVR